MASFDTNLKEFSDFAEKYGRYLCYIYYSKEHDDFEGIIRNGKMINEELVKTRHAKKYDD